LGTLLVDGGVDPQHLSLAARIEAVIAELADKPVGREGTFGNLAFSHELVHQIGGQGDSNQNTTRRILLLLESVAVGRSDAYDRVLKAILSRYLLEDRGFRLGFWLPTRAEVPFQRLRALLVDDGSRFCTQTADEIRSRSGNP
jgi:hypothetical protein